MSIRSLREPTPVLYSRIILAPDALIAAGSRRASKDRPATSSPATTPQRKARAPRFSANRASGRAPLTLLTAAIYPNNLSESFNRVNYPSRLSESSIRAIYPSRIAAGADPVAGPLRRVPGALRRRRARAPAPLPDPNIRVGPAGSGPPHCRRRRVAIRTVRVYPGRLSGPPVRVLRRQRTARGAGRRRRAGAEAERFQVRVPGPARRRLPGQTGPCFSAVCTFRPSQYQSTDPHYVIISLYYWPPSSSDPHHASTLRSCLNDCLHGYFSDSPSWSP